MEDDLRRQAAMAGGLPVPRRGGKPEEKFHDDPSIPRISAEQGRKLVLEERERRADAGEPTGGQQPLDIEEEEDAFDDPTFQSTGSVEGVPEWAKVPKDLKFPDGWQVWFIRFEPQFTNTPKRGERQCILWALSEADEKRGARRANGSGVRVIDEMTKCMIRAVDGYVANPLSKGGPDSITQFWNEIGGKCRHQLKSLYLKTHTMNEVENKDFFFRCVTVRTVG